jgi:DNA-binding transcriptional regulator YiaG
VIGHIMTDRPIASDIKAIRLYFGHTQRHAAELVHTSTRAWQQWEAGDRRMHPAFLELYMLKASRR